MRQPPVIIDNSTLVYYTKIQSTYPIWEKVRLLFPYVLIPQEIKNEYARGAEREPERNRIIDKLRLDSGFFRLCSKYDSVVKSLLETQKDIDKGEAEAIAQQKNFPASLFLTDDKRFVSKAKEIDRTVRIITSLHLAAMIDILNLDTEHNRSKFIKKLHPIMKFNSQEYREAFREVSFWYGSNISKKEISNRTSLKRILS